MKVLQFIWLGTDDPAGIVLICIYMAGLFCLFRKCRVPSFTAFIPCVRDYMLGKCAAQKTEGIALLIIDLLIIPLTLYMELSGDTSEFLEFAGLSADTALLLIRLVLMLRIFSGLCEVFRKKKRWIIAWILLTGLTGVYWGLSPKFRPYYEDEESASDERAGENKKRGRIGQVFAWLKRLLRLFIYRSDWKVFPMAAVVTGVVAYIVRDDLFLTMEGTLKGAYALACVAVWCGCFNSIQIICREKQMLRRERQNGLHISSYMTAHVIYQILLCLGQTALILYIFHALKIQYPAEGYITEWFAFDLGITIFLITFAADMLAMLISAFAPSTTSAVSILPFVLFFQMVFAGGVLILPPWCEPLMNLSPSHQGMVCLCAQADYNNLPLVTGWNTLNGLRDYKFSGSITISELLALIEEKGANNDVMQKARNTAVIREMTVEEVFEELSTNPQLAPFRQKKIASLFTLEDLFNLIREKNLLEPVKDKTLGRNVTLGQILEFIETNPDLENFRQTELSVDLTVGQIIEMIGEDQIREFLYTRTARVGRQEEFERSVPAITGCWRLLLLYGLVYALIAAIRLKVWDRGTRSVSRFSDSL